MVKHTWVNHFGPFWALFGPLWNVDRPAMFGHFRSKMDNFWAIPSHKRWTPKKAHHHVSYVWPACRTPKHPVWNISMADIYENVKNRSKFHEKWPFLPLSCHEGQVMGPKKSFLLIFSARDDLVKVSWKSDARKCPNPPCFDHWPAEWKMPAPLIFIGKFLFSLWSFFWKFSLNSTPVINHKIQNRLCPRVVSKLRKPPWAVHIKREDIVQIFVTLS